MVTHGITDFAGITSCYRFDEQAWTVNARHVKCLKKSEISYALDSTVDGVAFGKMKILIKAIVMMSMIVVLKASEDCVTDRPFSSMTVVHPWILLCLIFLAKQHCGRVFQYMFYVKFSVWCSVYHFLLQFIVI